ncbi:alpha/beta-hydrolase [Lojkania enalia]|uniref:Alpha/beta-hydrolase n=1 Tax=Lojkania enalia TaxID=147567 RepID=A0A9P4K2D1_9PLEO|nr:alpha/beta-hydrolase [Didymosphaeria enalia]
MSESNFITTEHSSPCSYIRQFPHGTKNDNAVLQLAIKEYRPRNNLEPADDSVTIIAAHANGFPKECYEPLWDDLVNSATGKIRAIWIADVAHQGASYNLNAEDLGDDPNWLDHSRDLFLMINHFRDRMKPPFVGFGHSMGALQIIHLALMHPRLLHSLIIVEPVLQDVSPPGPNAAMFSSFRREMWDSRGVAEKQISKNAFFQAMDSRVLRNYLDFALKDAGNDVDQDSERRKVRLVTPKAQEAWSYVRPNFQPIPDDISTSAEVRNKERLLNPEYTPFSRYSTVIWTRPEGVLTLQSLPNLRPRTLFLYGDFSHINFDEIRDKHMVTGTGQGGNGGKADGGVEEEIVEDTGHLCCFEKPNIVAEAISKWLIKEVGRWEREKEFWVTFDTEKSKNNRKELSDKWLAQVKADANTRRPVAIANSKL